MAAQKIVQIVGSCGECPHYQHSVGNTYRCKLVGETVGDKTKVAAFCPLTDFPSRLLAEMEAFIRFHRGGYTGNGGESILQHIGVKLGRFMHSNRQMIVIKFQDGENDRIVDLRLDHAREVTVHPEFTVTFMHDDTEFKLHPDRDQPILREKVRRGSGGWKDLDIR